MGSIFLVTQIDFDRMENEILHALYKKVLGYCPTNENAELNVARLAKKHEEERLMYTGWDKERYPQWEIKEVRLMRVVP